MHMCTQELIKVNDPDVKLCLDYNGIKVPPALLESYVQYILLCMYIR